MNDGKKDGRMEGRKEEVRKEQGSDGAPDFRVGSIAPFIHRSIGAVADS